EGRLERERVRMRALQPRAHALDPFADPRLVAQRFRTQAARLDERVHDAGIAPALDAGKGRLVVEHRAAEGLERLALDEAAARRLELGGSDAGVEEELLQLAIVLEVDLRLPLGDAIER